jgi:hypothetical protein
MKVELRKVKIARHLSEETTAFTADLWVDDKHIGYVKNSGHGGNNQVDHRYDGKGLNTRDEVRAFEEWCTKQPPHVSEYGELAMSDDLYISLLLEEWEENRFVKRLCKKETLFRLEGDPEKEYRSYKAVYTPLFAEKVRAKHPDLIEIINERFM